MQPPSLLQRLKSNSALLRTEAVHGNLSMDRPMQRESEEIIKIYGIINDMTEKLAHQEAMIIGLQEQAHLLTENEDMLKAEVAELRAALDQANSQIARHEAALPSLHSLRDDTRHPTKDVARQSSRPSSGTKGTVQKLSGTPGEPRPTQKQYPSLAAAKKQLRPSSGKTAHLSTSGPSGQVAAGPVINHIATRSYSTIDSGHSGDQSSTMPVQELSYEFPENADRYHNDPGDPSPMPAPDPYQSGAPAVSLANTSSFNRADEEYDEHLARQLDYRRSGFSMPRRTIQSVAGPQVDRNGIIVERIKLV